MNYNLEKVVESQIEYNIDGAMSYGDQPPSILMAKFEETDMGPDEGIYDNYARGLLTDHRPDTNTFEHEEPRGAVSRRSGRIDLQYEGHRGNAEVYTPERFDGDVERDPRGISVDPDMKEFNKQTTARNRFIRWDADGSEHITGGGRSEFQTMADQQQMNAMIKDRLTFERQIDGRVSGKTAEFDNKSRVGKIAMSQSYGDFIKDYATSPQHRANIICKKLLLNTKEYRDYTAETDFVVAKYSQLGRRAKTKSTHNPTVGAAENTTTEFSDADNAKYFKTVGLLMANVVKCKKTLNDIAAKSDAEFGNSSNTLTRKSESLSRDLALVLRAMNQDSDFASSEGNITVKTATPVAMEHLARQLVYNHLTPAHHYLNAEVLYKSVRPGADTRKIKDMIITDANAPELRDTKTVSAKTAKMKLLTGRKLNTADDADKAESTRTVNYKISLGVNGDKRIRLTSKDMLLDDADDTQLRRQNHTNYRSYDVRDVENNMLFSENASKERYTRGLGSKYMNKFIDRDEKYGEIAAMN